MVCKNGCTLYHNGFSSYCDGFIGNTAQSLCVRCAARFFGRLRRNFAGILSYVKGFLCNMTENQQADCVQSRQAGFVRYCLYFTMISQSGSTLLMHFCAAFNTLSKSASWMPGNMFPSRSTTPSNPPTPQPYSCWALWSWRRRRCGSSF